MNRYYKLDSRKVTYGEYWNIVRSPLVIIPWVAKLLNIPIKFSAGMPDFDSVRQLEVPEAEFSTRAREKLQPLLDKCQAMGFHSPRFFTYENMRRDSRVSFIAMLHPSGATVRLMHTLMSRVQPPQEKVLVVLLSELSDGTSFLTSSQRKQFISQPGILVNRLIGAGPERLLESHLQKLSEFQSTNPPRPVASTEQLDELWDRYEKSSRDFGMQRGIYAWMTPEEVAKESQGLSEVRAMTADTGGQNADVLLALHNLQNKKAGWGGIMALLVISLLLFVFVGKRQWSWNYLVILLSVLFVHEMGHYLAMRAFNYRNLRMFFIPLFGAAVSGQNHNVPGWKKVIVSLMGPLPGIILGIIVGVAGLALHQPWLVKVGLVSLLLNGFNLLPVLPLDGGWVFHTLIFSRHPLLDAVFRVVAAIALMTGGTLVSGNQILMYLGILMLLGVPQAYRTARLAADLKLRVPPAPPGTQDIPVGTANVIIDEIKKTTQKPQSVKMTAQQTLQIFETINAHPPGWAPTLGLLFVHLAGLGLAVVFALVLIVGQRGDFREIFAKAALLPKHALECGPVPTWHGAQWDEKSPAVKITVVATFPKHAAAMSAFQSLTNQLPPACALKCFGETLLLAMPADDDSVRKKWLAELQGRSKDVFVDSTNYHAAFSLICVAPNSRVATNLNLALRNYFETFPQRGLVPPWEPQDVRNASQRAQDELARQTYLKLQAAQFPDFTNATLRSLEKQMMAARKQGGQAEADALQEQIEALTKKLSAEKIERVRSGAEGAVDGRVVELFSALMDDVTRTNRTAMEGIRLKLAECMGRLPDDDLQGARFSAHYGGATQNGLFVNVSWVSFDNIDDGPMALAAWLCDQGCIGLKYDFQAGMGIFGEDGSD